MAIIVFGPRRPLPPPAGQGRAWFIALIGFICLLVIGCLVGKSSNPPQAPVSNNKEPAPQLKPVQWNWEK
jgi:hypothetical protein